ncbi:MAG: hypothetical protein HGA96_09765 [Desulfobulbaceae bacterium]|nr:hypothetical protein [Desulfobulbaceae bacterium]
MFLKVGSAKRRLGFWIGCLLLLPLFCAAAGAGELHRLAVVGVSNRTGEGEFSNLLIAQGVAQLVAQELYDVGGYLPVEDNPEITGRINELLALSTQSGSGEAASDKALNAGNGLGCEAVATVKIVKFSKSRSKGGLGPFSAAKVEIAVEVEVSLKDGDKPVVSALGHGTGVTKSQSVLFQVRKDKVHFDQTSAGQATLEAVKEAVAKLPRS